MPAARLVNKENIPELGNVTHQLHNMAERNAWDTRVRSRIVTKMSRVLVRNQEVFRGVEKNSNIARLYTHETNINAILQKQKHKKSSKKDLNAV